MSETKDTFGLGFRPQHYGWVTTHRPPEVDVFEIVSENFMGVGGRPKFFLEKLREDYPIIMHGVGLSIGSKGLFDPLYLKRLKELTDFLDPKMVSDHLSWTLLGQRNAHDLLPITYTHESMADLVGKLGYLQEFLGRRFYLENPSAYVAFQDADFDEAGFFAELLKRSGAGILLDINNLYVNQRNLNQDPEDFLKALRPEDVGYFHLAGHSDQGDVLVDTHDHPVPDSVWTLYGKARQHFPATPAIVEWDGNVPEFPVLLAECEKARAYTLRPLPDQAHNQTSQTPMVPELRVPNAETYTGFFQQIVRPFGIDTDNLSQLRSDLPVPAATGLKVYNHAYFLRLEEVLMETFPALAFITEEEGFRYLVAAFLEACPPSGSSLRSVGEALPAFLRDPESEAKVDFDFGVPLGVLGDLAALENARSGVFIAPEMTAPHTPEVLQSFTPSQWEKVRFQSPESLAVVTCAYEILPVLHAIDKEEIPSPPEEAEATYLVYRQNSSFTVLEKLLTPEEARLLKALAAGTTLLEACDALDPGRAGFFDAEKIAFVAGKFMEWAARGWIGEASPLEADTTPTLHHADDRPSYV